MRAGAAQRPAHGVPQGAARHIAALWPGQLLERDREGVGAQAFPGIEDLQSHDVPVDVKGGSDAVFHVHSLAGAGTAQLNVDGSLQDRR